MPAASGPNRKSPVRMRCHRASLAAAQSHGDVGPVEQAAAHGQADSGGLAHDDDSRCQRGERHDLVERTRQVAEAQVHHAGAGVKST